MTKKGQRKLSQNAAFTLLEVILALALTVLLITAISSAIHLNLLLLDQQRASIERAQVARSVLQAMARDLRAAVQYKPADVTGIQEVMANPADLTSMLGNTDPASALNALSNADPSLVEGALGGMMGGGTAGGMSTGQPDGSGMGAGNPAGGGSTAPTNSGSGFDSNSIASGAVQPLHVGLYGNSSQLSVDISRLPRLDEYQDQIAVDGTLLVPSDIKTVAYYVEARRQTGSVSFTLEQDSNQGGLYRRISDRSVATYAIEAGADPTTVGMRELLAPEVLEIEFAYFDGDDWQSTWDSQEQGAFPLAIEIKILVDTRDFQVRTEFGQPANIEREGLITYRTVVYLPVAEKLSDEEIEAIQLGTSTIGSDSTEADE
ncbi:MAG TPA: hypothetical protein PKD64_10930 [Pirellulaceae bacterium]|nr:hypothetical protein [Pirellulaceae bacterium]HMO92696.1 hypothetical protein [Pirellulaceae bacterium]HMP70383.1 hypothetical protein [Pirellulaceae bacterium]